MSSAERKANRIDAYMERASSGPIMSGNVCEDYPGPGLWLQTSRRELARGVL
jgi:hypothetical protein